MNELMEAVYAKCMAGGGSGELCAREAIAAAREAGWRKGEDGKWHRKEAMKETYEIPNVEIFGTGKHRGFGFDDSVIAQMVADTNAQLGREPFIFVGHSEDDEPQDSHPRAGLLRNLRFHAGKIFADFSGVPAAVYRAIKNGGFPKRSVELIRDFTDKAGNVYPWIIDAVALIGAAHPEVKDLRDISKMYASDRDTSGVRLVIETSGEWPDTPRENAKENILMAEELKPQEEPKAPEPAKGAEPAPAVADTGALDAMRAERDALKAELDALKSEKTKDADRIAALEKRINEMGVDAQLDKLVHEGKVTPAEREAEKALMMELLPLPNKVKFGEKDVTLYERRVAELSARKPVVEFGEKLPKGDPGDADEWTPERLKRAQLTKEKVEKLRSGGLL
ncbi:MAG: hypothetical protein FJ280_30570 [Planctomycetes bacterium]|nr:hypothetical protein [Planctomycetota bacterium]